MKYKIGNIIDAALNGEIAGFAHQCNCLHLWNSGLAPQVKERIPGAFEVDALTKHGNTEKLGKFAVYYDPSGFSIYNCYGQFMNCSAGGVTIYEYLGEALFQVASSLAAGTKFGLPKIGCGAAKGDWSIVSKLIEQHFSHVDLTVYVLSEKEIPSGSTIITD